MILDLATIYVICAPERSDVWWLVLALVVLLHVGRTLQWFEVTRAATKLDPRKPLRV